MTHINKQYLDDMVSKINAAILDSFSVERSKCIPPQLFVQAVMTGDTSNITKFLSGEFVFINDYPEVGFTMQDELEQDPNSTSYDELAELRLQLSSIEREYNRTCYDFIKMADRYYKQSITGTAIDIDELKKLLDICENTKAKYADLKTELMSKLPKRPAHRFNP